MCDDCNEYLEVWDVNGERGLESALVILDTLLYGVIVAVAWIFRKVF